jgi:hypothetical protein
MKKSMWDSKAVKAYETGQGVELVNEPYPHYVPSNKKEEEHMTEETNKCTACSCDFTDDEGGIHGDFGIIPMSFCPTCLSCMLDMAEQLNPKEWIGLTDEEIESVYMDTLSFKKNARALEAILMEKNT